MKKRFKKITSLILVTLLLCLCLSVFAEDGDPLIKTTKGAVPPPPEPPVIVEPIENLH